MKATTRYFDSAVDLNDVCGSDGYLFVRNGVGFAGQGVAARAPSEKVLSRLQAIDHENLTDLDVSPIAIGAMPFSDSQPYELTIPKITVGKDSSGRSWSTVIDDESGDIHIQDRPPTASASFRVWPSTPIEQYRHAVATVRDAVEQGNLVKAVIAREISVESSEPIDVHAVLLRLRSSFANSYRYSIDGFIGASPELLLEISGDTVRSHPLAGTTPRTGDPNVDEQLARQLVASMKDQIEHRVVIDVIHDMLLPWCSYLDWEPEPSVLQVANVQHLGTMMEGRLTQNRPELLELVRLLCPTPALGGHPRNQALQLITDVEGFDRGHYGGAVGWVDAVGNGTWAVAIRCAQLSPDRKIARLTAGGGIVAASEADSELAETQAKFQAMLSAIIRT